MAASDSAGDVPGGGSTKKLSGSTTPKNMSPIPMPALNIIEIHETVRNCGRSSSAPSLIWPYLLTASQRTKTTKKLAARTNNQPALSMTHVSAVLETDP